MKKTIAIGFVISLSMVSCKKDRTCTCTAAGSTTPSITTYKDVTKSEAKANCTSYTYKPKVGNSVEVTCAFD